MREAEARRLRRGWKKQVSGGNGGNKHLEGVSVWAQEDTGDVVGTDVGVWDVWVDDEVEGGRAGGSEE